MLNPPPTLTPYCDRMPLPKIALAASVAAALCIAGCGEKGASNERQDLERRLTQLHRDKCHQRISDVRCEERADAWVCNYKTARSAGVALFSKDKKQGDASAVIC